MDMLVYICFGDNKSYSFNSIPCYFMVGLFISYFIKFLNKNL